MSLLLKSNGNPLQYSCLENPMDGEAWWAAVHGVHAVHGVAKSWIRLSVFTFTFYFHALDMEMASHSSVLAWRIPGTGEPGGVAQSRTRLSSSSSSLFNGEGNGTSLQCSCLRNPRDGGAWWADVCGVAQSQTRLKRLSSSSSMSKRLTVTASVIPNT